MSMAILTAKRVEPDETKIPHIAASIGIASANSVESDGLGCISRVYFGNVTLMSHNMTLASQKPCQYNNVIKFDCSETNGYTIPQDIINEV